MAYFLPKLMNIRISMAKLLLIMVVIIVCRTLWIVNDLNLTHIDEEGQGGKNEKITLVPLKTDKLLRFLPNEISQGCSKQLSFLTHFNDWSLYPLLKKTFKIQTVAIDEMPKFTLVCPKYRCNVTVGVTLSNKDFIAESDGVVIYIKPGKKIPSTIKTLYSILPNNVTWFFWGRESPQRYLLFSNKDLYNISFHHAITYHSQSALKRPYGYFVPNNTMDKISDKNWADGKTHLIAWMAKNCKNTFWPRKEFVYELQMYIQVDIYGTCGNLTCLPRMSPECKNMLQKYKFYLALENSECNEYITEKFWDSSLKHGVVPVVYGGQRDVYEKLAPPNSFIHVGDFASARQLANYLILLNNNDELYNKYFQWRLNGHIKSPNNRWVFCETIPLIDSGARENTKHSVAKSKYFNSCRGNPPWLFSQEDSLVNWTPWK